MTVSISIREAFGKELVRLGKTNKKIVAVSCDLKDACKLSFFFEKYPKRSFEVGIAEANAVGISAGLSMSGFRPFLASFASFITGKNVEIRTSISYNKCGVVIVGTHGGLIGPDGATQSSVQDVAVMRSLPYFEIIQPSSPLETKQITAYSASSKKPTYLRIARNEVTEFHPKNYKFKMGFPSLIKKGKANLVISSGPILSNCVAAVKKTNKDIGILNLSSIKPLNEKHMLKILKNYRNIITVEDHSTIGGLGSVVAEILARNKLSKKFKIHGIKDDFVDSDTPSSLEKFYKLDIKNLEKIFKNFFKL